jgi:hypothetical protein
MSARTRAGLFTALAVGASLAFAPAASATATPRSAVPVTSVAVASDSVTAGTIDGGLTAAQVKPGYAARAGSCVRLWKPYGQKIKGKWYVVGGGRLSNCGATYLKVTLQQKRWWGWDDRSTKNLFRKGDANPKAKCKTFGKYNWRTTAVWYRYTTGGKVETLGNFITKSWRTKC